MSDIEGKAVQGNSERVWETNEFQIRKHPVAVADLVLVKLA